MTIFFIYIFPSAGIQIYIFSLLQGFQYIFSLLQGFTYIVPYAGNTQPTPWEVGSLHFFTQGDTGETKSGLLLSPVVTTVLSAVVSSSLPSLVRSFLQNWILKTFGFLLQLVEVLHAGTASFAGQTQ